MPTAKEGVQVESVTGSWRRESSLTAELLRENSLRLDVWDKKVWGHPGAKCYWVGWSHGQGISNLILSGTLLFSKDQQHGSGGEGEGLGSWDLLCSVHCFLPHPARLGSVNWHIPLPHTFLLPRTLWYPEAGTQQASSLCEGDGSPLTWRTILFIYFLITFIGVSQSLIMKVCIFILEM